MSFPGVMTHEEVSRIGIKGQKEGGLLISNTDNGSRVTWRIESSDEATLQGGGRRAQG